MLITGIIGYPLKKTSSPLMHNSAFKMYNMDGVYVSLPVDKKNLENAMKTMKELNFTGFNVTIPHKETIVNYLDDLSEEAIMTGAVNTVLYEKDKKIGFNTDVHGFRESLKLYGVHVKNTNVLLLGAGGAARSCAYVINSMNPDNFKVFNRNQGRAEKLAESIDIEVCKDRELKDYISVSDIIINATPVDFQKKIIPCMKKSAIYYDLNYNFEKIKTQNIKIIDGLLMLALQGACSFSLWTGEEPPVEIMKKELGVKID